MIFFFFNFLYYHSNIRPATILLANTPTVSSLPANTPAGNCHPSAARYVHIDKTDAQTKKITGQKAFSLDKNKCPTNKIVRQNDWCPGHIGLNKDALARKKLYVRTNSSLFGQRMSLSRQTIRLSGKNVQTLKLLIKWQCFE